MYDLPVVRAATDAWWHGLAQHMRAAGVPDAPATLARDPAPAWTAPDLLFSQTCGYPLTHALAGRVSPLCTPAYDAPGCDGASYASALVVSAGNDAERLADLRGGVCAFNAPDSHSGCNVLRRMIAPLADGGTFFRGVMETGSHAASIDAVVRGQADLCTVDAVTHELLRQHEPERLRRTRVLGCSPRAPGLPYIAGPAASGEDRARMRDGIRAALEDPALAGPRADLLITGAEALPIETYDMIPAMEREAAALGYPRLA
jgi:ABC-type phosphate/phosphonate transport system substrate-binding protein